ncbi:hypothetical protein DFH11DRAFT_1746787 [Phellopilus nigrolimitatus]|nr:hypothetical protein DFH11DRAFT_1746787 [Phellopilus nigrolimitatus]
MPEQLKSAKISDARVVGRTASSTNLLGARSKSNLKDKTRLAHKPDVDPGKLSTIARRRISAPVSPLASPRSRHKDAAEKDNVKIEETLFRFTPAKPTASSLRKKLVPNSGSVAVRKDLQLVPRSQSTLSASKTTFAARSQAQFATEGTVSNSRQNAAIPKTRSAFTFGTKARGDAKPHQIPSMKCPSSILTPRSTKMTAQDANSRASTPPTGKKGLPGTPSNTPASETRSSTVPWSPSALRTLFSVSEGKSAPEPLQLSTISSPSSKQSHERTKNSCTDHERSFSLVSLGNMFDLGEDGAPEKVAGALKSNSTTTGVEDSFELMDLPSLTSGTGTESHSETQKQNENKPPSAVPLLLSEGQVAVAIAQLSEDNGPIANPPSVSSKVNFKLVDAITDPKEFSAEGMPSIPSSPLDLIDPVTEPSTGDMNDSRITAADSDDCTPTTPPPTPVCPPFTTLSPARLHASFFPRLVRLILASAPASTYGHIGPQPAPGPRPDAQAARTQRELAALRAGAGAVLGRARAFGRTLWSPSVARARAQGAEDGAPGNQSVPSSPTPHGRDTLRRSSSLRAAVMAQRFWAARTFETE